MQIGCGLSWASVALNDYNISNSNDKEMYIHGNNSTATIENTRIIYITHGRYLLAVVMCCFHICSFLTQVGTYTIWTTPHR